MVWMGQHLPETQLFENLESEEENIYTYKSKYWENCISIVQIKF